MACARGAVCSRCRWRDARFGTVANGLIAVPLLLAAIDARPSRFRSRFARDHAALLARPTQTVASVSDADIASLPPLYQKYLRRIGAVGRPPVRNMRVRFNARMRGCAPAPPPYGCRQRRRPDLTVARAAIPSIPTRTMQGGGHGDAREKADGRVRRVCRPRWSASTDKAAR